MVGLPFGSCGSGRYDHLARRLNDIGVKVYGMDWTGESYCNAFRLCNCLFLSVMCSFSVLTLANYSYIYWLEYTFFFERMA